MDREFQPALLILFHLLIFMHTERAVFLSSVVAVKLISTTHLKSDCDFWRSMHCQLFERLCSERMRTASSMIRFTAYLSFSMSVLFSHFWFV
jgi:hypothetical protein